MRRLKAHAKVNLYLQVLGPTGDGFHQIESVFHSLELHDDVEVIPAPASCVEMRFVGVPAIDIPSEDNICMRAMRAFNDVTTSDQQARIEVTKAIPHGAGLGGGSADAAAVLVALNDLSGTGLSQAELAAIGGRVGSDVPFCLTGGPCLVTGRGENVVPLPGAATTTLWLVLGISHRPLSTRAVYDRWADASPNASPPGGTVIPSPTTLIAALERGDPTAIGPALYNGLEPAALTLRPELEVAKRKMLTAGALGAIVTGSGPTVMGLARDGDHARAVAAAVEDDFDRVEVSRTTTSGVS